MQLDRELLKQIATILSAHLGDETQRRAVLEAALFQSPTLDYIEWRGASYPFALRLTRLLIRLEDGNREEPELVTLLREIREQVGVDRQLEIDEVIETLTPAAISEMAQLSELAQNYIFISYTHHDAEFVTRLRNDLQEGGVNVWVDFIGLKAGTPDWEQAIRDAIRDSRAVLLVTSPQARESFYVRDEIAVANMEKKPIYPVWAAGEHWIDSVPLGMGRIQYTDARADNYHAALESMTELFKSVEPTPPPPPPLPSNFVPRNPYKGLRAFRAEDRNDFFGRDTLIRELIDSLQMDVEYANTLAVVGPSGSGKSSVVMAGLIPALKNGAISGSQDWLYCEPMVPGTHPISSLELAISSIYTDASSQIIRESIQKALHSPDRMGLYRMVQDKAAPSDSRVVVYVDQFEELFTLTESKKERQQFIDLLTSAATEPDSRLILILSMRADFYDRPMAYPLLGHLIDSRSCSVLPMRLADLRDVIVRPAEQDDVKLDFDDGLATELVYALREQAAALPLLQFTLDQLFEHRNGQHLTMEAYEAIGGLQGALAKHAQATYESIPESDRPFVRRLFLRLIEPGLTEQDTTRRRATFAELELKDKKDTATLKRVMGIFVDARLLLTDKVRGANTVEVSHEALIREWELLQEWLKESRGDIRFQGELTRDVELWVQRGKSSDDDLTLYHGTRLAKAKTWLKRNIPSKAEHEFIKAAIDLEDRRQREILAARRKQRPLRRFLWNTFLTISLLTTAVVVLDRVFEYPPAGAIVEAIKIAVAPEEPSEIDTNGILGGDGPIIRPNCTGPFDPRRQSGDCWFWPTPTPSFIILPGSIGTLATPTPTATSTPMATATPTIRLRLTTTSGQNVILRSEPRGSADVFLDSVATGTVVTGLRPVTGGSVGENDRWWEIEFNGGTAYVHSSVVERIP